MPKLVSINFFEELEANLMRGKHIHILASATMIRRDEYTSGSDSDYSKLVQ